MQQPTEYRQHCRLLSLVALVLMGFAGCNARPASQPTARVEPSEPLVGGEFLVIDKTSWPTIARVQGSFLADETTTIAARVAGRVISVRCDLGDTVSVDQPLVELDDREYQLQVAQADAELAQARAAIGLSPAGELSEMDPMGSPPVREAQAILNEAKKQAERMQVLHEQGTVVATDLEAALSLAEVAEARFNSAVNGVREKMALVDVQAAALDVAKQQLADTRILAPFSGSIQSRDVAVGTYLQAGQSMIELVRTSVLRFRASVPERFAQQLQTGQLVRITRGNQVIESKVSRISPVLDPLSRSLAFEAIVDNADGDLRSGLFGQAEVILNPEALAISVPERSVVRFAGVDKVWCVSDGMVRERVVELGREADGRFEITNGLSIGDRILLDASLGRTAKLATAAETKAVNSTPSASIQNNSVR